MKQVILITGASGFIGSWVCNLISKRLSESLVIGVGRSPTAMISGVNVQYISCDLTSLTSMTALLPSRVDIVIHLAGDGRTFLSAQEASKQVIANVLSTSNVIDFARSAKAEFFVQASSVYVYSGNSTAPSQEDHISLPEENLGATKIAAEALVKARACAGDFSAMALRMFTVYGPYSKNTQFIMQAICKLQSDNPIAEFGPGEITRDFIYVEDVATAFLAAITASKRPNSYQALNIGSGTPTTIRQVVFLLAELLCVKKQLQFTEHRNKGNYDHQAEIAKAQSVLNWRPTIPLRNGLKRTIEVIGYKV